MDPIVAIVAGGVVLTIMGIEYSAVFLTQVARGRVASNASEQKFFRAGHAHAGVLVMWAGVSVFTVSLVAVGIGIIVEGASPLD